MAAIRPAPGPQSCATTLPVGIQQLQLVAAGPREAGVDPAGARAAAISSGATSAWISLHVPTTMTERVGARAGPEQLAGRPATCSAFSALVTRLQRRAHVGAALERGRIALAADAVGERLGEGADDRGDVSVALQSCRSHQMWSPACTAVVAAPLRGLHPVDVVEPVARARRSAPAVDRLDEAAAVAGGDLEGALQHPHHGLRAGHLAAVIVET